MKKVLVSSFIELKDLTLSGDDKADKIVAGVLTDCFEENKDEPLTACQSKAVIQNGRYDLFLVIMLSKAKLGRTGRILSNGAMNEILRAYKLKGYNDLVLVACDLAEIKGDKSINNLLDNIANDIKLSHTRNDNTDLDLSDF